MAIRSVSVSLDELGLGSILILPLLTSRILSLKMLGLRIYPGFPILTKVSIKYRCSLAVNTCKAGACLCKGNPQRMGSE